MMFLFLAAECGTPLTEWSRVGGVEKRRDKWERYNTIAAGNFSSPLFFLLFSPSLLLSCPLSLPPSLSTSLPPGAPVAPVAPGGYDKIVLIKS